MVSTITIKCKLEKKNIEQKIKKTLCDGKTGEQSLLIVLYHNYQLSCGLWSRLNIISKN